MKRLDVRIWTGPNLHAKGSVVRSRLALEKAESGTLDLFVEARDPDVIRAAIAFANDKLRTATLLRLAGVPVPRQRLARTDAEIEAAARKIGTPLVVKGRSSDKGRAVTTNIRTYRQLRRVVEKVRALGDEVLIENFVPGDDYRLTLEDLAVFAGATKGNSYLGKLDLDGDWKIRVYLMRSAARRDERATYRLAVGITGRPDPTATREANDFGPREWNARGDLGCARGGQPMQTAACPFKVVRYAEGATIFVLAPGSGTQRILYFTNGEWSTDSRNPVQASKRSDPWSLLVSEEAYEVPDAVLFGG